MFLENPNLAVRPDYTSQEYEASRQQLVEDGLTNDQAARSLAALWTLANNADKERWDLRQQHLREMRQREENEEEEQQQHLKEEEEAARQEERKKNKNKYMPIVCGKAPSDPTLLPAQYATRKMKSGDYCELHYFTN
ncbi:hypothetical protein BDR05DRAFT_872371 [Suillus weaverae]|nr:hypothetical protein BDR05DRAFT_872371 [Suillus weaverae]